MLLDDVFTLLTSQNVFTSAALTKGFMPDKPDVMTAIYETGGQSPEHAMGSPLTFVAEKPRIQIVCRAAPYDYATARANAHAAFKALDGLGARAINGVQYKYIAAVQSPFLMGRDEPGRVSIACNFDIIKDLTP